MLSSQRNKMLNRRNFYGGISCHLGLKKGIKLSKYPDGTSNFTEIH
jgi:hypothetical protein